MKLLNLALIALLMAVVFLAPACAMELNQDKSAPKDDSMSFDDAIPSDIPIEDSASIDDIPSGNNGSDASVLPYDLIPGDDDSDASVLPEDDDDSDGSVLPDDLVPGGDNGSDANLFPNNHSIDDKRSDANRFNKDFTPSDFNSSEGHIISKEISNSFIFDNISALADYNCNDNTYSIEDETDAVNNYFDNFNKFHEDKILNDMSYDLFNFHSSFYYDKVWDYEKIIFNTLCCSDSFMESFFRPFRDDSFSGMKKTIGLIDLDSSAIAMNINGDYSLSLDIKTFDNCDSLLKTISDSIFEELSIEDSMDNKSTLKDLSSLKSTDLIYFSSDKTFKKCVKTDIFKVSII